MKQETQNLPAVRDPQQVLEIVKKYRASKDLVFVEDDDLRRHRMFVPELVIIPATPDEFHNISGNFMPKRHHMDRCAQAAGISFIVEKCKVDRKDVPGGVVYIATAQGQKRMPDGSTLKSSVCSYEFDPQKRAEEDIIRDTRGKYQTEKDKKLLLLTYQKFGMARADTGARLRVIKELTGMPASFKPNEIQKSMVFCRIAINTDELMEDPEMRQAAIELATGSSQRIFGPQRTERQIPSSGYQVNGNDQEQIPAPEEEEIPFNPPPARSPEEEEIEAHIADLKVYHNVVHIHPDAKDLISEELAKSTHDLDTVRNLNDRIRGWLEDPQVIAKYGSWKEAVQ